MKRITLSLSYYSTDLWPASLINREWEKALEIERARWGRGERCLLLVSSWISNSDLLWFFTFDSSQEVRWPLVLVCSLNSLNSLISKQHVCRDWLMFVQKIMFRHVSSIAQDTCQKNIYCVLYVHESLLKNLWRNIEEIHSDKFEADLLPTCWWPL